MSLDTIWGRRLIAVEPGDRVYLVAVNEGKLQLLGRFHAEKNLSAMSEVFGVSTPIAIERLLPPEQTARLRFVSRDEPTPPVMRFGRLDPQTMRGVRELTADSAALLDRWIDAPHVAARGNGTTNESQRMRALSVRQPWAELILRGIKTIEVRSRTTSIRERVYLYASPIHADLAIERAIETRHGISSTGLLRGLLVGTVEVVGCRPLAKSDSDSACFRIFHSTGYFAWSLANPERCESPIKPLHRAQPVWFYPF